MMFVATSLNPNAGPMPRMIHLTSDEREALRTAQISAEKLPSPGTYHTLRELIARSFDYRAINDILMDWRINPTSELRVELWERLRLLPGPITVMGQRYQAAEERGRIIVG